MTQPKGVKILSVFFLGVGLYLRTFNAYCIQQLFTVFVTALPPHPGDTSM
jgi:hypothetical protein